jgi:3-hydroxymyristoyl/3-hydroxydecanoyl-(acyl carrier protein) dehydratase
MTGGHLVFHCLDRGRLPLLLKVQECAFEGSVRPGVRLRARASLNGVDRASEPAVVAETSGEVLADGARVAAARLLFVCVSVPDVELAAFGALR